MNIVLTRKLLKMGDKGTLLIISGPSGSGKGTIVRRLKDLNDFVLSISVTTRKPRSMEKDGKHYFFRSRSDFENLIKTKKLLEWAEFVGQYYGTPKDFVEKQLNKGKNVILEIEVQGALQVKKLFPNCVLVFIIPPSLEELERRLCKRGSETAETMKERIAKAKEELQLIDYYDYILVNNSVDTAVTDIKHIVKAEKLRTFRNFDIIEQLKGEIFNAEAFVFRPNGGTEFKEEKTDLQ